MEELEKQLRLWALRRPSARLKRRLFGRSQGETPVPFSLSWLAPATAALIVMFVVFHQPGSAAFSEAGKSGPLVAMILSNQSAAASLVDRFESEQNNLPVDTFKWANRSSPTTSVNYFSPSRGRD